MTDDLSAFLDDDVGCAFDVDTDNIAVADVGGSGGSLPRRVERDGKDGFIIIALSNLLFAVHS